MSVTFTFVELVASVALVAEATAPLMSAPGIVVAAVSAVVPLPFTYPVRVDAPVPPFATTSVPVLITFALSPPILVLPREVTCPLALT